MFGVLSSFVRFFFFLLFLSLLFDDLSTYFHSCMMFWILQMHL